MSLSIDKIKLHRVNMTLNDPFSTSFGTFQEKEFFIIEMTDSEGHTGFGESVAFTSPWYSEETVQTNLHIMTDFLIPIIKNNEITHPDEISTLFQPIRRNNMAKAALEGAVWDLYAKQQNLPLAWALGGTRTEIDVGISLGIEPTVKDLLKKIDTYVQKGYKRIKIKIKPGHDVNILREVRRVFPDTPIMADANSAYTLD